MIADALAVTAVRALFFVKNHISIDKKAYYDII